MKPPAGSVICEEVCQLLTMRLRCEKVAGHSSRHRFTHTWENMRDNNYD